MRVQAEGQEKALRKQRNQGQRASQETLRALQREHLNRPLQTDVCEGTLVVGPTTHDVSRKGKVLKCAHNVFLV